MTRRDAIRAMLVAPVAAACQPGQWAGAADGGWLDKLYAMTFLRTPAGRPCLPTLVLAGVRDPAVAATVSLGPQGQEFVVFLGPDRRAVACVQMDVAAGELIVDGHRAMSLQHDKCYVSIRRDREGSLRERMKDVIQGNPWITADSLNYDMSRLDDGLIVRKWVRRA